MLQSFVMSNVFNVVLSLQTKHVPASTQDDAHQEWFRWLQLLVCIDVLMYLVLSISAAAAYFT
jgi:hypothetical protein